MSLYNHNLLLPIPIWGRIKTDCTELLVHFDVQTRAPGIYLYLHGMKQDEPTIPNRIINPSNCWSSAVLKNGLVVINQLTNLQDFEFSGGYPLVIQHSCGKSMKITLSFLGKSTISMAIFNSYVKLSVGTFGPKKLIRTAIYRKVFVSSTARAFALGCSGDDQILTWGDGGDSGPELRSCFTIFLGEL